MRRPPSARHGIRALVLVLVLFGVGVGEGPQGAFAKEKFTGEIADHLGLSYEPPCRLCHIQGTTGPGTIQTPFGMSMLARGLTGSGSSVTPALDLLAADGVDSDGDGVSDVHELEAASDPNTAAKVSLDAAGPDYGCAVSPGAHPVVGPGHASVLLAGLLLLLRGRGSAAQERSPARSGDGARRRRKRL